MDSKKMAALEELGVTSTGEAERFYKGFIYGEYGVGKTVTLAKLARKKLLLVHTDKNYQSVFNHPEVLDKVVFQPYTGLSQLDAIAEAITEKIVIGGFDYGEIDLVGIDTISQIQEEYLDWLFDNYQWGGRLREAATPAPGSERGLKALETLGRPDYKVVRDKMRGPIKKLIKAPVDVVFTAHLREPNATETTIVRRPTLTEAAFKLIAREVNFIGLQTAKKGERTIQFETDAKTVAKSGIKELNSTFNVDEAVKIIHNWKEGK